jgi:quinol-cytochrome oxidoreductase complex cytochrome b subunit
MFLVVKIGISGQPPLREEGPNGLFDTTAVKKKKSGRAFFPYIIFKDAVVSLIVVGLVVLATIFWPIENSMPVDPNNPFSTLEGKDGGTIVEVTAGSNKGLKIEPALQEDGTPKVDASNQPKYLDTKGNEVKLTAEERNSLKPVLIPPQPEWYFLFLFQFLKIFPPEYDLGLIKISGEAVGGIIIPTILILVLLLAPILDRGSKRSPLSRPITSLVMVVFLIGCVILTFLAISDLNAAAASSNSTSSETPAATTAATGGTTAAATTAATGGTPAVSTGNATAGSTLFRQVCQSCHAQGGRAAGPAGQPQLSTSANAGDPAYIRNIVRNGKNAMAAYDKDTIPDADLENLVAYILSIRQK